MRKRWYPMSLAGGLLAAGLWFGAAPLAAQVEMSPALGVFWPLGGWIQDFGSDEVERRHLAATFMGARLAFWPGTRFGLEGLVGFTPSQVAVSDLGGTQDITAGVVLSSVRVLTRVLSLRDGNEGSGLTQWDFYGGLGGAVISRNGSAWANTTGTTHPAAVASLEVRTHMVGAVMLRLALEDYVTWATFNKGRPSEMRSRVQNDLVVTLGAAIPLGKGR